MIEVAEVENIGHDAWARRVEGVHSGYLHVRTLVAGAEVGTRTVNCAIEQIVQVIVSCDAVPRLRLFRVHVAVQGDGGRSRTG